MRVWRAAFGFAVLLTALNVQTAKADLAGHHPKTISVMPFFNSDASPDATWMNRGVQDLMNQKLAQIPEFRVLERQNLKAYLKEMEFQQSGLAGKKAAARLARVAGLDYVVFGSYKVESARLHMHVFLMDAKTYNVVSEQEISGKLEFLQDVLSRTLEQLLNEHKTSADEDFKRRLKYQPSSSLPAVKNFYLGLEAYDQGRPEDAVENFYEAFHKDPQFHAAFFWFAKMYEAMGFSEQAALLFERLYSRASQTAEGKDALIFSARLFRKTNPEKAAALYSRFLENEEMLSPHTFWAKDDLAQIHKNQNRLKEAYLLWQEIDHAVEESRKNPQAALKRVSEQRYSAFFSWHEMFALYRPAILNMIELYPHLLENTEDPESLPETPRGMYVLSEEETEIGADYPHTKSLFFESFPTPNWKEKFVVLLAPKGFEATGAKISIEGRLLRVSPNHSYGMRVLPFPMPRDFQHAWLGALYGQTDSSRVLSKDIYFHGENRRLMTIQLIENHSEIFSWKAELMLEPAERSEHATSPEETQNIGFIQVQDEEFKQVSKPQSVLTYEPKRKLAIGKLGLNMMHVILASGDLAGRSAHLWESMQKEDGSWSAPQKLPFNSMSDDFAPVLKTAEDGSLRLFWISNRRGLGWELWTAEKNVKTKEWSEALRVPLPVQDAWSAEHLNKNNLLEFDAVQSLQGEWIIVQGRIGMSNLALWSTRDFKTLTALPEIKAKANSSSLSLNREPTGVFALSFVRPGGDFRIGTSTDLKKWQLKTFQALGLNNSALVKPYPTYVFPASATDSTFIYSDVRTGLQYSNLQFTNNQLQPDLVEDVALEPFAVTKTKEAFWVAAWKGEAIEVKRMPKLREILDARNDERKRIYFEKLKNQHGEWTRIFARPRFVVPDVTAVEINDAGRMWWGIETGIMSLKGGEFYFQDVSQGFFHHHVTGIKTCGDKTYFTSSSYDEPHVGWVRDHEPGQVYKVRGFGLSGSVAAQTCFKRSFYYGTSGGEIALVAGARPKKIVDVDRSISGLVVLSSSEIWAAAEKDILKITEGAAEKAAEAPDLIQTMVHDSEREGFWIAFRGGGIQFFDLKTNHFKPIGSLEEIRASKLKVVDGNLWILPSPKTKSAGLGIWDEKVLNWISPPKEGFEKIVDFEMNFKGKLMAGTEDLGVYLLKEKK